MSAIRSRPLLVLATASVGAIGIWFFSTHQPSPEKIAATMLRSTVAVHIEDRAGSPFGSGSGFVVAPGVVATCLHVVEGGWRGTVRIGDTAHAITGLLGTDREHDLALIAVEGTEPALPLSAAHPTVAEPVFVAGNPQGLDGTFSQGVISAVRKWKDAHLLQMSAAVSPGSSGGPVLNARGEVIGVTTMSVTTGQNLNFAVPIEHLLKLMNKSIGAARLPLINAVLDDEGRGRSGLFGLVHTVAERGYGVEDDTTFDVFGQPVERRYRDWQGSSGWRSVVFSYEYDEQHRIVSEHQHEKGSPQRRCRYNYTSDSSGATRSVMLCGAGEGLDEGEIVEMDSVGRPTVRQLFRPYCSLDDPYRRHAQSLDDLSTMLVEKYHYDTAGCNITHEYENPCPSSKGASSTLLRRKCDDQGREAEVMSTRTFADGRNVVDYNETTVYSPTTETRTRTENGIVKTTTCSLELDSVGNWLSRTCTDGSATRRVITYY